VLELIGDKTVIELVCNRVRTASSVDNVVVATSEKSSDDELADFCLSKGFAVIRGSEENVLQRFILAIDTYKPTNVLRVTADCPLVDPELIDSLWSMFDKNDLPISMEM
jgi:spore coat polysaccharide biosynthesis protein SpsF